MTIINSFGSLLSYALICGLLIFFLSARVFRGYHDARRILLERLAAAEGTLPARLKDGSIRLLSVSWLLAQPDDWCMQRQQDLPSDAHVPTEEAVRLLQQGKVGALSYRWLTAEHPDLERLHLSATLRFFRERPSRVTRYQAIFWECVNRIPTRAPAHLPALFTMSPESLQSLAGAGSNPILAAMHRSRSTHEHRRKRSCSREGLHA